MYLECYRREGEGGEREREERGRGREERVVLASIEEIT